MIIKGDGGGGALVLGGGGGGGGGEMRKVRKRHQIFYLPYSVSNNLNNLIYKQNEMNYKRFIDSKFSSVGGANLCNIFF